MRTTTWTEVQDDIRVRCDLPTISTTTKPTTAQLLRMANQSLQRRDAMLAEAYGDDYRTNVETLTTQIGLGYVSLPSDFLKLKNLLWQRGTDDIVTMRRASPDQQARLALLSSRSWSTELPLYRFRGTSTLLVMPTPNAAYTLSCEYVQTTATLTTGADTIQDGPGWTEWLVCDVCVKIATLEEKDPSVFMSERAAAEQVIRSQAPDRDEYESMAVRDVSNPSGMSVRDLREWYTRNG